MADSRRIAMLKALDRRTRRTIIQNLAFSLSVIAVLVTAALTIGIPLPLGVVGHEGSTIIVVPTAYACCAPGHKGKRSRSRRSPNGFRPNRWPNDMSWVQERP
jgi:hypothetical protein